MASHDLDHQKANGESIITELKQLRQQIQQLRTLQSQGSAAVNLQIAAAQTVIIPSLAQNSMATARFELNTDPGNKLFGVPLVTVYEGVPADNTPFGISDVQDTYYYCAAWIDHRESTDNKLVAKAFIYNYDLVAHQVSAVCSWRYLISPSSTSGSGSTT